MRTGVLLLWFALVLPAVPAAAQHLSLDIRNGQVTLDARNVTIPEILAEWTRVGGVRVINADKVAEPSVTLLLRDLSERQALDIVLRSLPGYILVAKTASMPGSSAFEGILILPSSAATPDAPGSPARFSDGDPVARPGQAPPPMTFVAGVSSGAEGGGSSDIEPHAAQSETDTPAIPARDPNNPAATTGTPPPTPLLAPAPPQPVPGNPFGNFPAARQPGGVTPTGPPPGVVYPPVTNPNAPGAPAPGTPTP